MNKNLFVTFGCSWTQGLGVGYHPGQSKEEYISTRFNKSICDTKSFRGILSKNFKLDNKNFSHGASSNQAQFNYAKKYFGSSEFVHDQESYEKIIVLHAITSTARNVLFDAHQQAEIHIKYVQEEKFNKLHAIGMWWLKTQQDFETQSSYVQAKKFSNLMINYFYDHEYEVKKLAYEMNFWNVFYKTVGIKNIWVDTFNHHDYPLPIDNMIMASDNDRDLLSQLCIRNNFQNFDKKYHYSDWNIDGNRITTLVANGLLNPISYHPTEMAHIQIADFIAPTLQSKL
jgi:hypothetical protein